MVFDDLGLKWPESLVCSAPKDWVAGNKRPVSLLQNSGAISEPSFFRMTGGSMQVTFRLVLCGMILSVPFAAPAQESSSSSGAPTFTDQLPEAPAPQDTTLALAVAADQQANGTPQSGSAQPPAPVSSSSQAPAAQSDSQKSQHDKAEEQLKQQEKQRVMGVMATFNTTRNKDAVPLSSGQKFKLFFKSATDPWPFLLAGAVAGIGQAENSTPEWGQGAQGYAKRFGAGYSDYFIGNFFGNAVLPSLWHEDPRYFQKGTGSSMKRFLWAAASTVWCKRDNGTWGPNYANVVGNMIGSAIGRAYYPPSDRTVGGTINDGLTVSAEGIVGAEVIEFWPDMVRAHRRKQAEKMAAAEKKAAEEAGKDKPQ